VRKRRCNADPLPLTAGKPVRKPVRGAAVEPEPCDAGVYAGARLATVQAGTMQFDLQMSTHCGASKFPTQSLHLVGSIQKT
jgi:hypothetical protein